MKEKQKLTVQEDLHEIWRPTEGTNQPKKELRKMQDFIERPSLCTRLHAKRLRS